MRTKTLILLQFLLLIFSAENAVSSPEGMNTMRDLVGENHLYAIDFLFFEKLAEGQLQLTGTEDPGVYRVTLIGRTLGIASWLAGDRIQTYTALMKLTPEGSLQSIEYKSQIRKKRWGKWTYKEKNRLFDYDQKKIIEKKTSDSGVPSLVEYEIPGEMQPVDMLTAFYNLRIGVYGPLAPGKTILVPTFSSKGFVEIEAHILTKEEQKKYEYFPETGLLIQAVIDPEIFETKSGHLFVWFDQNGIPSRGVVEDMIGLGDVRGYLSKGSP